MKKLFVIIYLISIMGLFSQIGCETLHSIKTNRVTKVTQIDPNTKNVVVTETTSSTQMDYPEDLSNLKDVKVTTDTVTIGSFKIDVSANSILKDTKIYYIASVLLIIVGIVVTAWLKQFVLGISLMLGGVGLGFLPILISTAGPIIAVGIGIIAILVVLCGIAYIIGKYVLGIQFKKVGEEAYAKLATEGRLNEAIAVKRATNPKVDKAFKEVKPLVTNAANTNK